jgi:hypothetical protein
MFLRFFQNSQIIYRHLQLMFLIFNSCWPSEVYTTYIGPFDKSLFLHVPQSVKSTPHSHPLSHQEDGTEKYKFFNL